MLLQFRSTKRGALRPGQRRGVGSVEYTLIASLILTVLVLSVSVFSHSTKQQMNHLATNISADDLSDDRFEMEETLSPTNSSNDTALLICFMVLSGVSLVTLGLTIARDVRRRRHRMQWKRSALLKKNFEVMQAVRRKHSYFKRLLRDELASSVLDQCKVRNFMTEEVATVSPDLSVHDAIDHLEENQLRRVLVKNNDGTLAGVVSRKDIALQGGKLVRDIMTDNPKTVGLETKIQFALTVLLQNRISCLPVVDNENQLLGVISTSDLMIMLHCLLSELHEKYASESKPVEGEHLVSTSH